MTKSYAHTPALLMNIINDIAEMRKAKVIQPNIGTLIMDTEMYGIKTEYRFLIEYPIPEASVTVETDGEDEEAERRVQLMFATLENMLIPFSVK